MDISVANNYNNRKDKNPQNLKDTNTTIAQKQANIPAVQSLAQSKAKPIQNAQTTNPVIAKVIKPTPWSNRQNEAMNSNSFKTMFSAPAPTPFKVNPINYSDTGKELTNKIIGNLVAMKNNIRYQNHIKTQQEFMNKYMNREAQVYMNDTRNDTNKELGLARAGAKVAKTKVNDPIKMGKIFDTIVAGRENYDKVDWTDEANANRLNMARARYAETGEDFRIDNSGNFVFGKQDTQEQKPQVSIKNFWEDENVRRMEQYGIKHSQTEDNGRKYILNSRNEILGRVPIQ